MLPEQFFGASRLVIVAGKGGVGKTTVSAALARAAALCGLSTLVVEVEGKSGLPGMFGQSELGYDEVVLSPGGGPDGAADVRARTLTADQALLEYLQDHGLSRISRRLVSSGALDVVATAAPGIKDILLLGKVKQLERSGAADLIVLDAPAAGHAITFLQSARTLLDTVRVGPIQAQARDVLELLEDHSRCQVFLVTLAEETPVNEAIETAYALEDRVGIGLGPIFVNGVYPEVDDLASAHGTGAEALAEAAGVALRPGEAELLDAAAAFRLDRVALQQKQLERLAEHLPLPQIRLPFLFTPDIGPAEVDVLARAVLERIDGLVELPT
ncbi:MAG TPA: ArsA-related P-loop ATPase [Microthrixaceae bacterium]|nr:ArsA-related P-loop ATPase [Microthrixaceae bacterium]